MRVLKNCLGEYWERVESECLPENGRIYATTSKMVESVRVPKNYPGEYRKRVESV